MQTKAEPVDITALICTADRPAMAARAARSILASAHPSFELIVVDQSIGDDTRSAIGALGPDARLRYLRAPRTGKGTALNLGLEAAGAELVACTDDDCEVPADWLERMARAFDGGPNVAAVFGTVTAAQHDTSAGFIPTYLAAEHRSFTSVLQKAEARGIGACMGLRRAAVAALGGFDPAFGPGATFPSCDDWDITTRALIRGFEVLEVPGIVVIHHGFRTFREGREHARRDWYAIGAACAKPLRAGVWRSAIVAVQVLTRYALWPAGRQLVWRRGPLGLMRITGFLAGFWRGLRIPVDQRTLVFRMPPVALRDAAAAPRHRSPRWPVPRDRRPTGPSSRTGRHHPRGRDGAST
jgi:GT2 family glycosyltransferase